MEKFQNLYEEPNRDLYIKNKLIDRLTNLKDTNVWLLAVGEKLKEEESTSIVLNSFPQSFENIVETFTIIAED